MIPEPFGPVFDVHDLLDELGRNYVVARDTPVGCLIEMYRILRSFQINHKQSLMTVLHDVVGLVLRVGLGSNGDTSEKYTILLPFAFLRNCLNLHVLRIQGDTAMMRILSQSFGAKTSICPDSHLSDLVEL